MVSGMGHFRQTYVRRDQTEEEVEQPLRAHCNRRTELTDTVWEDLQAVRGRHRTLSDLDLLLMCMPTEGDPS